MECSVSVADKRREREENDSQNRARSTAERSVISLHTFNIFSDSSEVEIETVVYLTRSFSRKTQYIVL